MIHYGDITKISGYDVPIVDCVVGGSPCQDLSVAGKRAGLDGERSGLFMEQLRLIKELRDRDERSGRSGEFIRPRFMVWENVPGAFSSNKGEDFRIVLEETAKVVDKDASVPMPPKNKWTTSGCIVGDGWSIAWRVCDAQFYGVPQRRRRIALVADFGGECASEILFIRKCLHGDSSEGGTERKGSSSNAQGCIGVHDREGKTYGFPLGFRPENVRLYDEKASTKATDSDHIPCVVMDRSAYNQGENAKFNIGIDVNGIAFSHIAKGPGAVCYVDTSHADDVVRMDDVVAPLQARDYKGGKYVFCLQGNGIDRADTAGCNGKGWKEGTCYTLNTIDRPAVAYGFYPQMKAESIVWTEDKACALVNGTNPGFHNGVCCKEQYKSHYIVRRLTPLECERLQGFPDGWTDIGEYIDSKGKKKKTSDSARYKALGNSIAIPPWKWIIKRLCSHYERDATMASLFDGIGGFPHIWEQINGKGSCLWASEIEDFPIAVTEKRINGGATDEKSCN